MTLFKIFLQSTGLSLREAASYLDVSYDSVKNWLYGRHNAPDGVLYEMSDLIDKQNAAAAQVLDLFEDLANAPDEIEIGYCADDHEAQALGWPCKSAHDAVIRRVVENASEEIREAVILVPRGSTATTAAAEV